jgi:hypothetical protein
MQLVSNVIFCCYVWVGVASHLLTHRSTTPSPSLPLFLGQIGWLELRAPAPDMRVGSLGVCVACGVGVHEFYVFHFLLSLSFTNISTIK